MEPKKKGSNRKAEYEAKEKKRLAEEKVKIDQYFEQMAPAFEADMMRGGMKMLEYMSERGLMHMKELIDAEFERRTADIKIPSVQAQVDMLKKSDNA